MNRFAHLMLLIATMPSCEVFADESFLVASDAQDSIAVLRSDASLFEKAKACQRIAVVGDESAIDVLAELITHPQLSVYSLSALSRIPGDRVDRVLVDAIDRSKGRPLVGVLHATGQREIEMAVSAIARRLRSAQLDEFEVGAAVQALGSIGTASALEVLRELGPGQSSSMTKRLHADAIKKCDQRLSRSAAPNASFDEARFAADLSSDEATFRHALMTARRIGPPASRVVARHLASLPPARQSLALICLADLGSSDGLSASKNLISSEHADVAIHAVRAVAKLGGFEDSEKVPGFVGNRPDLAMEFMTALASVRNDSVDRDVVQTLQEFESGDRLDTSELSPAYIEYAALRRLSLATPSLMKVSLLSDSAIRTAALEAAGLTVTIEQFPDLISRVLEEKGDQELVTNVLQRACVHLPQEAAAEAIARAIEGSSGETKSMLLSQLAFLGGAKALDAVTDLAFSEDQQNVDFATRVLGEWTTADVAGPLLRLADELPEGKYRLRALRGYLRVGRQLDMPASARLELCQNGFRRAQRDDERVLVLEILNRFPSKAAFIWFADMLDEAVLENRQIVNRAFHTLAHVAVRVAEEDPVTVSKKIAVMDLSKAPPSARTTLDSLR